MTRNEFIQQSMLIEQAKCTRSQNYQDGVTVFSYAEKAKVVHSAIRLADHYEARGGLWSNDKVVELDINNELLLKFQVDIIDVFDKPIVRRLYRYPTIGDICALDKFELRGVRSFGDKSYKVVVSHLKSEGLSLQMQEAVLYSKQRNIKQNLKNGCR